MSTDDRKPFVCPQCGGRNFTVTEQFEYHSYFNVEDGIMHSRTEHKLCTQSDETWIDCIDCRQESDDPDGPGESEWIASKEEKKIIWAMKDKSYNPTDVSEFLKND